MVFWNFFSLAFVVSTVGMRLSHIQYNLDGSNTDGSFTMDDSNSVLSP